ncbi:MAG: hypothetical protein PHR35_05945 [Kiritimatiellae bacterium]|nr:hypothetical protein [Kiritimatiellia bacterium]
MRMTTSYPFLTMRLWELHKFPAILDEYLRLLKRRRGACDEVWFASEYGFPPLSMHRECAAQIAAAAEKARASGFVASLQISNTLGHGSSLQYLDFSGIDWQRMTGPDGTVSPYNNCPRDPEFLGYLAETTSAYAAWKPASVWMDDDLRMHNHAPVRNACFCPRCLDAFSAACGKTWLRKRLVKAINADNDLATRRAWLAFTRQSLVGVARVVAQAVRDVAPKARLGLQHSDPCCGGYNGPDFEPVFRELARISGQPVGSRPGGGTYIDHTPRWIIDKAVCTGLQNSRLPACVADSRAEVENLPGAVTGKSARGTVLESTLALAYGCTGLTFTPLMFLHEETAWHERVLAEIAAWRPFWLRYLAVNRNTRPAGLEIAFSRRNAERLLKRGEPDFAWARDQAWGDIPQMTTVGLPLCWGAENAVGVLLHPFACEAFSGKELRTLLRRGVITDGATVNRLQERGLGHLLPVSVQPASDQDRLERFTDDTLNGSFAGGPPQLGSLAKYALVGRAEGVRCLSRYERIDGTAGAMAVVAAETAGGGRLVVFGNGFWDPVVTTARRAQILAASDWVSRGRLPVRVETAGPVMVIPRADRQGRLHSLMLLNCCLDRSPVLKLRLRRPAGDRFSWLRPGRHTPMVVKPVAASRSETQLDIPPLDAWGIGVLFAE